MKTKLATKCERPAQESRITPDNGNNCCRKETSHMRCPHKGTRPQPLRADKLAMNMRNDRNAASKPFLKIDDQINDTSIVLLYSLASGHRNCPGHCGADPFAWCLAPVADERLDAVWRMRFDLCMCASQAAIFYGGVQFYDYGTNEKYNNKAANALARIAMKGAARCFSN